MLQPKGSLLVGQLPGPEWTITRKIIHALTNNICKKPMEVENSITPLFENRIYLPEWIHSGVKEGISVRNEMHVKQVEIASTIDATFFLALIAGVVFFFVTVFEDIWPIFKEALIQQVESLVNDYKDKQRTRKLRYLRRLYGEQTDSQEKSVTN